MGAGLGVPQREILASVVVTRASSAGLGPWGQSSASLREGTSCPVLRLLEGAHPALGLSQLRSQSLEGNRGGTSEEPQGPSLGEH